MQNDNNVQNDLGAAFSAFQQRQDGTGEPGQGAQQSVEPAKEAQNDPQQGQAQGQTEQKPQDENPTNQSFARMRVENGKMSKQLSDIEAVLKTMGYENASDFLAKKAEEEIQKSAQQNNVPVDLEKRIRSLEEENRQLHIREESQRVNQEVGNLVQKYNIDRPKFNNFLAYLQANNINPMATPGVSLETYYVQFDPDAVFQARLAEEKKKWEAEYTKGNNAPINTPQGKPSGNPTPNNTTKVDWRALAEKYKK